MRKNRINKQNKDRLLTNLLFILIFSIYLMKFNLDIGVSLKPFMLGLVIAFMLYIYNNRAFISKLYNYEKVYIIFIFYAIIRGGFSIDNLNATQLSIGFIIIIVLYLLVSNIIYRLDTVSINSVIFFASLFFQLISLVLFIIGNSENELGGTLDRGMYRLIGTINDPNIFVLYSTLIFGISIHMIFKKEYKYWITFFLSIITILLTYSRGGILGILIFTIMYLKKFKVLNFKTVLFILVGFLIFWISSEAIFEYSKLGIQDIIEKRFSDLSGSGRLRIWANGLKLFEDNPFFGIGLYNFKYYNLLYFKDAHYMHNTYLEVLVENGLIGGSLLFVSILFFIVLKPNSDEEKLIKLIIYSQMIMLVFLSGLINEFLYLTLALYKGFRLKYSCNENL